MNSCLASGNLFFSMTLLQGWGAAAAAWAMPGSVWDPGFSGFLAGAARGGRRVACGCGTVCVLSFLGG